MTLPFVKNKFEPMNKLFEVTAVSLVKIRDNKHTFLELSNTIFFNDK